MIPRPLLVNRAVIPYADMPSPDAIAMAPLRAEGLELEQAGDGFIVYQADRDRIHYLNHTATLVFEACSGELGPAGIAQLLATLYNLPQPPAEHVESVLAQLEDEGLIVWKYRDEKASQRDRGRISPDSTHENVTGGP